LPNSSIYDNFFFAVLLQLSLDWVWDILLSPTEIGPGSDEKKEEKSGLGKPL
jgi:hypothetical protein